MDAGIDSVKPPTDSLDRRFHPARTQLCPQSHARLTQFAFSDRSHSIPMLSERRKNTDETNCSLGIRHGRKFRGELSFTWYGRKVNESSQNYGLRNQCCRRSSQTDSRRCLLQTLGLRGQWARIPRCRACRLRLANAVNVAFVGSYFQSRRISILQKPWPKLAIPAVVTVLGSDAHLGYAALRITLRFCSRYREFPTT